MPNLANFSAIEHDPKYFIQAAISQYFIDNFLFQLHKHDLIEIDTGDALNTTLSVGTWKATAGGDFVGYDDDGPCKVILKSLDPYPQFIL